MFADRVKETTTTTGTGAYALGGAQSPFRGIDDAFSNDDVVAYHVVNADASVWESGYGTYNSSGPSLSRTLLASSTGSLIDWAAGTKFLYVAPLGDLLSPIFSSFAGATRLGFLQAGAIWPDTGNNLLKHYNGTADIDLLLLTAATQGDVPYFGASGVPARLGAGTARLPLLTGGAGANPAWGYAGLNPGPSSELTIASGAVTATGGHHSIDTESAAASDDLDTITVTALLEGECLILKAENAARVVTVKHGTGNITLAGDLDYDLDSAAKRLVLQKVGSNLVEVARSAGGGLTSKTAQATTSGTAFDFTGIPDWVKRITVMFSGVSLSGTDELIVQIGDSGGIETSGYLATRAVIATSSTGANFGTAGFNVPGGAAARVVSGIMVLALLDAATNTWVASGTFKLSTTEVALMGGEKSLSATLDRVRLTRTGSDTFDAGSVNILYE